MPEMHGQRTLHLLFSWMSNVRVEVCSGFSDHRKYGKDAVSWGGEVDKNGQGQAALVCS